jgi:hypothetical protein
LTSIDYPFAVKVGGIEMLRRVILGCMMVLVCLPVPNQAWPQQESHRPIRILVEGEGAISRSIIEAVRRANAKNDIRLEFASGYGSPYDLRLSVRSGIETQEYEMPCDCEDDGYSTHYNHYFSTTADALTADGKLLFSVNGIDGFGVAARVAYENVATEIIKKINLHFESLMKESISRDRVSHDTINQIEPKEGVNAKTEDMPKEPGVYYKDGSDWVLLAESLANVKSRGVAMAILTIGISSVRYYDVYGGHSSKLQFREQNLEFYVRGYPIQEGNVGIVRLKKVKDQREVQSSSTSFLLFRYSGTKTKDIHRVKVTRISDDFYKLLPDTELKTGEYVLDLDLKGPSTGAYDFGIMRSKN